MHMKLFSIGPLNVYSYGLMIALGIIAAVWLAMRRCPARGLDKDWRQADVLYRGAACDPSGSVAAAGYYQWLCGIRRNHYRDSGAVYLCQG